jgi:hypothetical protein
MAETLNVANLVKRWVEPLSDRLDKQKHYVEFYQAYYDGKHKTSFTTDGYREEFDKFLTAITDNWMPIVVDAVSERMDVRGFRFDKKGKGDEEAWDLWQASHLDADSELLHTAVLTGGTASVMVWVDEKSEEEMPLITVEDPCQVYVATGGPSRRERIAGIKVWADDWTGNDRVNVYLPDNLYKIIKTSSGWQPFENYLYGNPLGVVPIVPFFNRGRLKPGTYKSELYDVTPTQDQINKILCDAIVSSEYSAFTQRWVTGMEIEKDATTGKPINPFESGQDRVFVAENDDARFGQFEATDLQNYVKMLENRVQSIASRSRTPAHYLLGSQGSFPSGESLKATETGLVSKIRQRQKSYGECWEEVMRLAFKVMDDPKADYFRAETIWADVESRTEAEHVDALVKLRTLNVPLRQLWQDAGYGEEEIARFVEWAKDEAMNAALALPSPIVNVRTNGSIGGSTSDNGSAANGNPATNIG